MGIVTAFMLPGTSYFREMCSCRRAVPVRRSTTRICRLAEEVGGRRGCESEASVVVRKHREALFSLSRSRGAAGRNGTGRDERGKVARNASATVRSPVADEQIRNMGGGNIDLG